MTKKTVIFLSILIILFTLTREANTSENVRKSRFAKDHIIVKIKNNNGIAAAGFTNFYSDKDIIESISEELNLKIDKIKNIFPLDVRHSSQYFKFELNKFYLVYFTNVSDIEKLCNNFQNNTLIDFSEPDYIGESAGQREINPIPNDEYFSRQWGLYNDGTISTTRGNSGKQGADMKVIEGWNFFTGSSNIIVAILDSGVKLNHPELDGRIWINPNEVKNGRDDDGNGYIDDINGWNFSYENSNTMDDGGHGTNIAGTIGAKTNNSIGYSGIDQNCKLMVCKNLDSDNLGQYSWWSESVYYAANNGAKILNMSEGGYDFSKTLKTAIDYAYDTGCLIVASMMNKNNGDTYYPAAFNNVLAVGATDTDDSRCKQFTWGGGSNWGKHIAVVAPGNRIYGLDYKDEYDYSVYWSGTSQATAYISATASMLLGQNSTRTNIDLRKIIISTADDQVGDPREDTPGWDEFHGYGRVNLVKALTYDSNIQVKYENRNRIYNTEKEKVDEGNKSSSDEDNSRAKAIDKKINSNRENNDNNKIKDNNKEKGKAVPEHK